MTALALRSPRLTAMALRWVEDFRRGRLGIAKNQGIVTGGVGIAGKWGVFDGDTFITYPRVPFIAASEVVIGTGYKEPNSGATWTVLMSQYTNAGDRQFMIQYLQSTGTIIGGINIAGSWRSATVTDPSLGVGEHEVVVRWKSGDRVRLMIDGIEVATSAATYVGVITDGASPLIIAAEVAGLATPPFTGMIAEPFISKRWWTEEESVEYHDRSLFH